MDFRELRGFVIRGFSPALADVFCEPKDYRASQGALIVTLLHPKDFELREDRLTVAPHEAELHGDCQVLRFVCPLLLHLPSDSMSDDRGPLRHCES